MPATKVFPNAGQSGPTVQDVAELIKEEKVRNLIILVGAGVSTAAGIPDFRSPGTGLYDNLSQYDLPYPEAIFDISYFFQRPEAFFTLAREIYPGNFLPTLTHYFFKLCHDKRILKRVFTQNVDTLERQAGLPAEMLVEAHGSFAQAHCLNCRQEYQAEELRPRIAKGEVIRCDKDGCQGKTKSLIKSDIVFFGESLPSLFFKRLNDFKSCDLLLTIGTSLKVQPFASLIDRVDDDVPRLLINLETVGEMDEYEGGSGSLFGRYREEGFDFNGATRGGKQYARDAKYIGQADAGVRELVKALGWEEELDALYEAGRKDMENKEHLRTASLPPTPAKGAAAGKKSEEKAEKAVSASPLKDAKTEEDTLESAKAEAQKVSQAVGERVAGTGQSAAPLTDEKGDKKDSEADKLAEGVSNLGLKDTPVGDQGTDTAKAEEAKGEADKKASL